MTPRHPRPSRHVLLMLFREDKLDSTTWRVPLWAVRAAVAGIVVLAVALLLGLAFYAPVARAAARVPGLTREVARLEAENTRIEELALALDSVEQSFLRLRRMVGADIIPDPVPRRAGSLVAAAILVTDTTTLSRQVGSTPPRRWPLDETGFVTRGATDSSSVGAAGVGDEPHPGLDIAVREGSLVRAAGGGTVEVAGFAPDYGLYVLLGHPGGYQSMYGHLSRITVDRGALVSEGGVIGLSGNTGRSSAPHLHFEIRLNGRPVDPAGMVQETP